MSSYARETPTECLCSDLSNPPFFSLLYGVTKFQFTPGRCHRAEKLNVYDRYGYECWQQFH